MAGGGRRFVPWVESILLTLLIPLAGVLFNPEDRCFINGDFPWIWFGPLLVALRYGIAAALGSTLLLVLVWFGIERYFNLADPFPLHNMLGGALVALLAGQFSSSWQTRPRRADQHSAHAAERFQQLSRAYFMVRHSHDRLEQNLISRPVTLRQAMMELRQALAERGGDVSREMAGELMVILSHYCSITSAAIYPVRNGQPLDQPLAQCGNGAVLKPDDLLIRYALESGTSAYQAVNSLPEGGESSYLVVAPLATSNGKTLGVVLVSDMPFMALQRETLQILGVLLAYSADHIEASWKARQLITIYPDCPTIFGAELVKMGRLKSSLDINSIMVLLEIRPIARLEEICLMLEQQQRGLDHIWKRELAWGVQFITLMPFSGVSAMEGFQNRLDEMLASKFRLSLNDPTFTLRYQLVSCEPAEIQLSNLLTGAE